MMNKKCDNCDKLNSEISKYCSQCGYELPKTEQTENKEPQMTNKPESKSKKVLPTLIGIFVFAISFYGVKALFNNPQSFDKAMMNAASELNETCPIMVDSDTRLDNTVALPDRVFQYNYTLVNLKKDEINISDLKSYIEPSVINNLKTNPEMKNFRDNDVTMAYNYRDKDGAFILKFSVTPDMYK